MAHVGMGGSSGGSQGLAGESSAEKRVVRAGAMHYRRLQEQVGEYVQLQSSTRARRREWPVLESGERVRLQVGQRELPAGDSRVEARVEQRRRN